MTAPRNLSFTQVCKRNCIQNDIVQTCGCFHVEMDLSLLDIDKFPRESKPKPCSMINSDSSEGHSVDRFYIITYKHLSFPLDKERKCFSAIIQQHNNGTKACGTCQLPCRYGMQCRNYVNNRVS